MATWPTTLPKPDAKAYSLAPGDQTIRTDMEVGSARVRRRTVQRNDRISAHWVFTDAQMATFRAWFDDASTGIAGGASWFTTTMLAVGTGGTTSMSARFVGPYKAQAMAPLWSVTADLEVR